MSRFLKRQWFGISTQEILSVFLFYVFFSLLYHVVLKYNQYGNSDEFYDIYNFRDYWYSAGMQYFMFFIASLVIYFIGVFLLRNKTEGIQMVTVAVFIPIAAYVTREIKYEIVDYLELGRLRGTGTVWDWYIPSLFLLIQFGCFFAYRYFRENQRKLRLEGELRQAALKSELSAIKAQLNPHFLYNVFNTINASVPAENERTRRMIAELSDLFRYQLKATKQEKVPLREELSFVSKYLDLEKERFENRLRVHIEVAEELMDVPVPPMLLQPLVENSVKHGLSGLIDGGEINIKIFKENELLRFIIADTGIGVENPTDLLDKGIGLTNTKLRLQKMYNSTLEILHNDPQGLKIQFAI